MSSPNSRRRRSCTISMCRRPRNPQRKPNPRASDDSWWNVNAESFRCSFSSPCSTFGNSSVDIGYIPQNTVGCMSWNPGSGSVAPSRDVVTVSPILISLGSFTVPTRYPTCPAESCATGFFVGENMPVSWIVVVTPEAMNVTLCPALTVPSTTRTYVITPRNSSNTESNTSARSGASLPSVTGGGMRFTIASSTSGHPTPVFADTRRGSSIGIASMSSTSRQTSGTFAPGRSTLFSTGTISSFASWAKYVLATVCASTPCAASTTRRAPSHAPIERDTS